MEDLKRAAYFFGLVGGGVYLWYQFQKNSFETQSAKKATGEYKLATDEDVIVGNRPPVQKGGFQPYNGMPGSDAMEATERGVLDRGADKPLPAPSSRHARSHRSRRG
jgi:hypothetical protein